MRPTPPRRSRHAGARGGRHELSVGRPALHQRAAHAAGAGAGAGIGTAARRCAADRPWRGNARERRRHALAASRRTAPQAGQAAAARARCARELPGRRRRGDGGAERQAAAPARRSAGPRRRPLRAPAGAAAARARRRRYRRVAGARRPRLERLVPRSRGSVCGRRSRGPQRPARPLRACRCVAAGRVPAPPRALRRRRAAARIASIVLAVPSACMASSFGPTILPIPAHLS